MIKTLVVPWGNVPKIKKATLAKGKVFLAAHMAGNTYAEIGAANGLTREGVRQMVLKFKPNYQRRNISKVVRMRLARRRVEIIFTVKESRTLMEVSKSIGLTRCERQWIRKNMPKDYARMIKSWQADFANRTLVGTPWTPAQRRKIMAIRKQTGFYKHTSKKMQKMWNNPTWKAKTLARRVKLKKARTV